MELSSLDTKLIEEELHDAAIADDQHVSFFILDLKMHLGKRLSTLPYALAFPNLLLHQILLQKRVQYQFPFSQTLTNTGLNDQRLSC